MLLSIQMTLNTLPRFFKCIFYYEKTNHSKVFGMVPDEWIIIGNAVIITCEGCKEQFNAVGME